MKTKTRFFGWMFVVTCLISMNALAFYDPGVQRWVNRDPLGDVGSLVYQTTDTVPWGEDQADDIGDSEFLELWTDINRNLYGAMGNSAVNSFDAFGLTDSSINACARSNPGEVGKMARELVKEAAEDMARRRAANEFAKKTLQEVTKKADRIKKALDRKHLNAAREELRGKVVARKADGTPFNHIKEVQDAQRGLANQIQKLKETLGNTPKGDEARALEKAISDLSKFLDQTKGWCP